MKVEIKKLVSEALVPKYAKEGDSGLDMTAITRTIVNEKDHGYIEYSTGLAIAIPTGFVGLLFPRSSVSNTGLILANSVGMIDSGYRGEIKLRFKYVPDTKMYEVGERVGQLMIIPRPDIEFVEVETLSETVRGIGGFGSTGQWVNNENKVE